MCINMYEGRGMSKGEEPQHNPQHANHKLILLHYQMWRTVGICHLLLRQFQPKVLQSNIQTMAGLSLPPLGCTEGMYSAWWCIDLGWWLEWLW